MNQSALFFRFGKFIFRKRVLIIALWFIAFLGCLPFVPDIVTPFKTTGFVDESSESVKVDNFLDKALGNRSNQILISYSSKTKSVTDPDVIKKIKHSLSGLKSYSLSHDIIYPDANEKQVSKDKHMALVLVSFKTQNKLSQHQLTELKTLIKKPAGMQVRLGGEPVFVEDISKQTQKDLYKADSVAAPVSVIIMILVFGSVIAALIPVVLGGGCALIILISLYFLGHAFVLSIFTLNIALLLGLCLCLDYSLFIISRFRDELRHNGSISEALAVTLSTAGRAVFYSGLAVFISLSALLIFPINILFSIGVGGLVAVFFAVAISIILLPAVLAVLKSNINRIPVRFFKRKSEKHQMPERESVKTDGQRHFWRWLAAKVVKRPLFFFFASLIFLLFLGYPFIKVNYGISDVNVLPEKTQSRSFYDHYQKKFNVRELTPIVLVVTSEKHNILSRDVLSSLYDFAKKISANPRVYQVDSIVTMDKKITKKGYWQLYGSGGKNTNPEIQQLLKSTTRPHFTTLNVVSRTPADSLETRKLISQLKTMKPGKGLTLEVTGIPVNNKEVLNRITTLFPYALAWIIVLTYVILLFLLRSLFLPLKAILMNMISLTASYGVLVFIFQEGHLHSLLNFAPQNMLDVSLLIIIFCAIFGFSMDYEVFLLTRIKECYEKTKDNNSSIIYGIDQSSRIITSAAVIVIVLCGSFMVADVLMVKEFGLGIAVAIFVDAFLVRSILVPSTMVLLKKYNWYLPRWLDEILP